MADENAKEETGKKPRSPRKRWALVVLLILAALLVAARAAMPTVLLWYVNRTIDKSPLYDGHIGDIDVHLWRGAYSIEEIRLVKTTGNVPVPLFAAERVDLAVQWDALARGKMVGRVAMKRPELNFVDGEDEAEDQTGAGGPWLEIIDELFPFKINSLTIDDGSIHFLKATLDNLKIPTEEQKGTARRRREHAGAGGGEAVTESASSRVATLSHPTRPNRLPPS